MVCAHFRYLTNSWHLLHRQNFIGRALRSNRFDVSLESEVQGLLARLENVSEEPRWKVIEIESTFEELTPPPLPTLLFLFESRWLRRGCWTKESMNKGLNQITGIEEEVLRNSASIVGVSVARKMSWAASRQTTRSEDIAYCLLGIFNVNMPLLYGEGPKAFMRLQEEIIKTTNDLSIFAWKASDPKEQEFRGILARSPSEFNRPREQTRNYTSAGLIGTRDEFSVTNRGVKIESRQLCEAIYPNLYILPLGYETPVYSTSSYQIGIFLPKVGVDSFVRARPCFVDLRDPKLRYERVKLRTIYVAKDFSANVCHSIHSIRRSAIQIKVSGLINIEEVRPEGLWDSQNKLLLVPEPSSFWGLVDFSEKEILPAPNYPGVTSSTYPTISILFFLSLGHRLAIFIPTRSKLV